MNFSAKSMMESKKNKKEALAIRKAEEYYSKGELIRVQRIKEEFDDYLELGLLIPESFYLIANRKRV
jgi:hypothetical protein